MIQKNKNRLLIVGFLALLVISYRAVFSRTLSVKQEFNALKEQSANSQNLAQLSANLMHREKYADSVLKKHNVKNISIQNNLLEVLNTESEGKGFEIVSFQEPHKVTDSDLTITSYQFALQGDFDELLQVIYQLEQNYNFGQLVHVSFEKKKDYRKRKNYLICNVIIESLIQ